MFSEITDTPAPEGVLTDAEAESLRANWHAVAPADREFFQAHLNQYQAFRASLPRRADIERQQQQLRTLEDLATDYDGAIKARGINPAAVELAPVEMKQQARDALVVDTFLRQQLGEPPKQAMRPFVRDALAREFLQDETGVGSDGNFVAAARTWATGRRAERLLLEGPDTTDSDEAKAARDASLFHRTAATAISGRPYTEALAAWQTEARGKPGFNPQRLATYESQARAVHEAMQRRMSAVAPAVEKVIAGFVQESDAAASYGGDQLIADVLTVPPADRPVFWALLQQKAAQHGADKEAGAHLLEAFGRGSANLLTGTARAMESGVLEEAEEKLAALKPGDTIGGRFPDLWSYLRGRSAPALETRALKFLAEPLLTDKEVTAEDIAGAKAKLAQEWDKLGISQNLEAIAKGAFDPLKPATWLQEKITQPFAEQFAPQLALFALTRRITPAAAAGTGAVGTAINLTRGAGAIVPMWGLQADGNAAQLMQLNPDMSARDAFRLGRQAAVAQSGLEYVQALLTFGTGGKLGQALKTAQASAWRTFGKSLAINAAGQNLLEGAQDLAPVLLQALSEDAPEVPWQDFFQGERQPDGTRQGGYWAQRADTFFALLPMVVLGAGGNTMRARASRQQLETTAAMIDDVTLHAAGIPAESRTAILAETDAVRRLDAFSVALKGADKATAEEGAARMQKQRQAAEGKFSAEMQRAGVTLERAFIHDEPVFKVTAPGGTVTHHAQVADAMEAVTSHLDAEFVKVNKPAMDMLAALQERPQSPTEQSLTKITARQASAADALLAAEEAGNTALADAMKSRMAVEQAKTPDAPIDWQKMSFPGQSELDVKEGLLRAVTRIEAGGSALTPLEERAETDAAAWVDSGELTWEELTDMIREVEAVTGDTYLNGHTGGQDAAQDQMAAVEGYSLLTKLYATGQGRSGAIGAAARSERAGAQQRLKEAERGGIAEPLMNRLRAAWDWFRQLMTLAARVNKARREGKLGDIEVFLRRSVGIAEETAASREVLNAAGEVFGPDAVATLPAEGAFDPAATDTTTVSVRSISRDNTIKTTGVEPSEGKLAELRQTADQFSKVLGALEAGKGVLPALRASGLPGQGRRDFRKRVKIASQAAPDVNESAIAATTARETLDMLREDIAAMERALYGVSPASESGFSLSPTATLEALSEALGTRMARDPDARRKMVEKAREALAKLKRDWTTHRTTARGHSIPPLGDKLTPGERDRRQAAAVAEALDNALAAADLVPPRPGPRSPQEQREAFQRFRDARAALLNDGYSEEQAAALADVTGQPAKVSAIRDAMEAAEQQAEALRETDDAQQQKDWSERAVLVRNLRILDAILSAFPPDVRAAVGGWVSLARLKTDRGMANEIDRRISLLDKELESSLQKSLMEEITALREKAEPKREGGKRPQGKIGHEAHRFFDAVGKVAGLTDVQVEGRRREINEEMARLEAAGELTPARAADLFEAEQTLDMFGNLAGKNAAHLARALDLLQDVYDNGRNRWRTQEEARLEEVRQLIRDTVAALGGVSKAAIQDQKDSAGKALSLLKSGRWSIKSFTEVMEGLFGRNHVLALRWSNAVRQGFAERTNEIVGLVHRWRAAMNRATGKKGRKARMVIWEMGHRQTIALKAEPFTRRTEEIPVETFAKILAGEADATALGLSAADVDALTEQFEALPDDSRKGMLTLERVTRGTAEAVKHTEAEAIFLSMLYGQEAYRDALARAGYGAETMDELEEQLSPAAKSLRLFLQKEYRDGYEPLARVFRRMFGVDLPQIENYAPGAFYHTGGTEVSSDPFGPVLPDGGFRAGFLKDRKPHTAAPKAESAFSVFFGHANQAAHWKALGEITRELRAVFGNPDVKQAVEGAHGQEAMSKVSEWMTAIEGNGIAVASSKLARAIFTMQAHTALAWKIGTLMKQSTALLGAWYRMPSGAYLRGLGRLLAGKLDTELDSMWNSDLIQRRLVAGFTPEVRAVLANAWGNKPHFRNAFLERGMEVIGFVDAFFTTGSAAISYDYHYRQAIKAGQSEAAARAIAEQEAADMVSRTAQPVEVADRSLMELNLGGLGRAMFMFGSEARQKSSLWITAVGNTMSGQATKEDARVLFISHFILGPMIQSIVSFWRDIRDDDDSDEEAMEHWKPEEFLAVMLTGPLSGLPLVRDVSDAFHGESGPLARFYYAFVAAGQLFSGPEDYEPERVEWYAKRIAQVLQGGGSFTAVAGSIGDQAFRITDNLFDDEVETGVKQLRKEREERANHRAGAMTEEQREAKENAREREREAEIKAAAQRAK